MYVSSCYILEKIDEEEKQNLDGHLLQANSPKDVSDRNKSEIKSGSSLERNFLGMSTMTHRIEFGY